MSKVVLYGVIGVAVLILIVVRQTRQREFDTRRLVVLPLVFVVLGVLNDKGLGDDLSGSTALILFAAGILVGVVMGALRGWTIRVWTRAGVTVTQGDWRTVALWLVTVLVRVGLAVVGGVIGVRENAGEAFIFVAVTLAVQNVLVYMRASRLNPGAVT